MNSEEKLIMFEAFMIAADIEEVSDVTLIMTATGLKNPIMIITLSEPTDEGHVVKSIFEYKRFSGKWEFKRDEFR